MSDAEASLIATRQGAVGALVMNRPRALNALDQGMVDGFAASIAAWRAAPELRMVLLEGAGGRAFCAGGDVRGVRQMALEGDKAGISRFFATEYGVNGAIAAFPHPWVSLIDGICMGGGIGVSVHGSHRVVTGRAVLAMPETAIGLFPDVGTSYVLTRLPGDASGAMGRWLALTGARLQGAEAVEAGLATHFVPDADLPALRATLLAEANPAALGRFSLPPARGRIAGLRPAIERCFGPVTLAGIEAALEAEGGEWAAEQQAILRRVSPTSIAVTLELLRRAATLDLPACLEMDLTLAVRLTQAPDFIEGVRAVLVDKDNAPRWQPAPKQVGALFA